MLAAMQEATYGDDSRDGDPTVQKLEARGVTEGDGDGCGDQHHAGNSARAEDGQVHHCPERVANDRQHQQRDRSRTREAVHNAYDGRSQGAIGF